MLREVEGIIIKETPYGETSKIINVYTKEGVIGVMCKGARSLKSPFRATTLKFTYGVFNIFYKENKLSQLISVDVVDIEQVPTEYKKEKTEISVDKTAVKNHFKETGEIIAGTEIIQNQRKVQFK